MKLIKLLTLSFILGIFEPTLANRYTFEKNLIISMQSSEKWVGKWIGGNYPESFALLIYPDGSWYFKDISRQMNVGGVYSIKGNKLQLAYKLDDTERMVYRGKTSIPFFECEIRGGNNSGSKGNYLQFSPKNPNASTFSGGRILTLRKK